MAKDDSVKDGSVALIGALAAETSGGAAVAITGGVLSLVWDRVASRQRRRAEELFERMGKLDGSAEAFRTEILARLQKDDEGVLVAVRALLNSALDAVSPAAMEAIAVIGRQFLRSEVKSWVARGWIRILSEVTDAEIAALRELAAAAVIAMEVDRDVRKRTPVFQPSNEPRGVAFLLSDGRPGDPRTLNAIPAIRGRGAKPAASGHAERLFDLMVRHGVGTTRENLVRPLRTAKPKPDTRLCVELDNEAALVLIDALGVPNPD